MQSSTQQPVLTQRQIPVIQPRQRHQPGPLASLLAGAIAGGVEAAATYPFEFAKTRAQLRTTGAVATHTNPFSLLRHTLTTEGVSAIYTGCSTLVVGTALKAGVRFFAFDSIKATLVDEHGQLSASRGILAGMAAGAAESVFAVTPAERLKTALIDDAKGARRFRSGPHAASLLIREQGVTALYRGLVSTTMKQSATSAVRMGSYNWLKTEYSRRMGHAPKSSAETFGLGAVAGVLTVYATQPLDTIKTRAQSSQGQRLTAAIRDVVMSGGVRAFWAGSTMRLGRLVFSGGIVFTIYEKVIAIMSGGSV